MLWLAMACLFLVANRGAYKGYFSDDDLDNLVQTRGASPAVFAQELVSPKFSPVNFRAAGHFFYKVMGSAAGLNFPAYIAVLHALHLLNGWLVWLVLRRLGAPGLGAMAGTLLFAFHVACFDAYWKPMFVFDVLCATFLLTTILLYLRGHWLLALIPYWLAYKSKEPAVTLPAFLLAYEYLCGERRWRRVVPFALIAGSFIVQAMIGNRGSNNDYTLRLTSHAFFQTLSFYSSRILLLPFAGLILIPLAWFVKDARVRLGLAAIALLLGPMWFLPGRLFGVYLYVPLIGAAIAFAFLAARWNPAWIALFFLIWLPGNYYLLRKERAVALTVAFENKPYVEALGKFLKQQPGIRTIIFDGGPSAMHRWGIEGAMHWFQPAIDLRICDLADERSREFLTARNLAVISWDRPRRKLVTATRFDGPDPASIVMATGNPVWLFGDGWYPLESGFRWMQPRATARLRRPAGAGEFFLRINLGPIQFQEQGPIQMEVLLDGRSLGLRTYDKADWLERRWPVPADTPENVEVTLRAPRPFRASNGDPRIFGAAVAGFGFVE
jgi:hypothetical protein